MKFFPGNESGFHTMPTEVTPAPFRYEQQLPHGLEHPRTYANIHPGWSHPPIMPSTGPARAIQCVPHSLPAISQGPGRVFANGMRNPWAPYANEGYQPASEHLRAMHGGIGSGMATAYTPRSMMGGGTTIVGGGGGGSEYSVGTLGMDGLRMNDGWEGSLGRQHLGHAPDMTSTAGRLGSAPAPSSWMGTPSSYANHAPMTPPSLVGSGAAGLLRVPNVGMGVRRAVSIGHAPHGGGGGVYLQAPVAKSGHGSRRSSMSVPIDDACCAECCGRERKGRSRSGSGSVGMGTGGSLRGRRRGSPLRYPQDEEVRLERRNSARSEKSGH